MNSVEYGNGAGDDSDGDTAGGGDGRGGHDH